MVHQSALLSGERDNRASARIWILRQPIRQHAFGRVQFPLFRLGERKRKGARTIASGQNFNPAATGEICQFHIRVLNSDRHPVRTLGNLNGRLAFRRIAANKKIADGLYAFVLVMERTDQAGCFVKDQLVKVRRDQDIFILFCYRRNAVVLFIDDRGWGFLFCPCRKFRKSNDHRVAERRKRQTKLPRTVEFKFSSGKYVKQFCILLELFFRQRQAGFGNTRRKVNRSNNRLFLHRAQNGKHPRIGGFHGKIIRGPSSERLQLPADLQNPV
ncbi:MAG: hypothetical protein BWY31_04695 [Lentisphaerae bacterium ADurb.Bin242]|nr:MAG: hypothetical protein BWY31_04695 [Lentisphaerae bacterium ADurb.Bin242]